MYTKVGTKLQALAIISMCVGVLASLGIGGSFLQNNDTILLGIIVIVAGIIFSWIASLGIYGFGQLIENSDAIVENTNNIIRIVPVTENKIKNEKEHIAQLLRSGKITQAEYDRRLMKLQELEKNPY